MRGRDSEFDDEDDDTSYSEARGGRRYSRRSRDDYDDEVPVHRPMSHSMLGIVSFAMSLILGVLLFLLFVIAGIMESTTPGGIPKDSPKTMVLGLLLIAAFLADLVALGLGIAGLCASQRKKVFALLGTIFAAGTLFVALSLMVIGSLVG